MSVVIDPGVFVAAFVSSRAPRQLLDALYDTRLDVAVCPLLVAELSRVLRRERFRRYGTEADVDAYLRGVVRAARRRPDPSNIPADLTPDRGDDYLVAFAEHINADALISGDHHLTELTRPGLIILTPRKAVETLLS